jgi:N-acetylglucosamine-6-phosphate deacetylase
MLSNASSSLRHIQAKQYFDGQAWHKDWVLTWGKDGWVNLGPGVSHGSSVDTTVPYLIPALVDLQIYGAGGSLLSVEPSAQTVEKIAQYCRAGGAAWFQPTVATNSLAVFKAAMEAVRTYQNNGGKGCLGLHLEGPWIHPEKRGAHSLAFIHSPTATEVREILALGKGVVTMITLAPEVVEPALVAEIMAAGMVVSAGHSQASYQEATRAFDAGVPAATHLYNAMSGLQHRAPGMVGAIMDHHTVKCSIVPDGYHVDWAAIRIAHKAMGTRLFAITDAVTETQEGPYPHQFFQDRYESNGILSGSALTMLKALKNLHQNVGISLTEAIGMCSTYPAQLVPPPEQAFLALDNQLNFVELFC